jgi:hypothetical protein
MMKPTTRILMAAALLFAARSAFAGSDYTSTTDSSWFNGNNWASNPVTASDNDIWLGQGFANLTTDGVVFDPVNDPNFQANTPYDYDGSSPSSITAQQLVNIGQLYLAGGKNATSGDIAGKVTIKSGTLTTTLGSTGVAIGRPNIGSSYTSEQAMLVMTGGTLTISQTNGDLQIGAASSSSSVAPSVDQNNTLDYTNAIRQSDVSHTWSPCVSHTSTQSVKSTTPSPFTSPAVPVPYSTMLTSVPSTVPSPLTSP